MSFTPKLPHRRHENLTSASSPNFLMKTTGINFKLKLPHRRHEHLHQLQTQTSSYCVSLGLELQRRCGDDFGSSAGFRGGATYHSKQRQHSSLPLATSLRGFTVHGADTAQLPPQTFSPMT